MYGLNLKFVQYFNLYVSDGCLRYYNLKILINQLQIKILL